MEGNIFSLFTPAGGGGIQPSGWWRRGYPIQPTGGGTPVQLTGGYPHPSQHEGSSILPIGGTPSFLIGGSPIWPTRGHPDLANGRYTPQSELDGCTSHPHQDWMRVPPVRTGVTPLLDPSELNEGTPQVRTAPSLPIRIQNSRASICYAAGKVCSHYLPPRPIKFGFCLGVIQCKHTLKPRKSSCVNARGILPA